MNTLRSNVLSNFASKAVQALGMLLFTPMYLRILGLEAVGLIGLWTTVRSFLTLLDFGMSTTLNREIAAARASEAEGGGHWNSVRTLEAISWSIALAAGLLFAILAPWTAHNWLQLTTTRPQSAIVALIFLGCAASFQLPTILYQGGLTGMERQVSMNGVIVVCSLARDVGSIVVLHLFPPTVVTFFFWQALISAAQCLAQRFMLTRALPTPAVKPRVDFSLISGFGGFMAGTGLISVTIMFVGLSDRIVLTKMVPMALFGVYSLAQTAAGSILILVSPLTTAAFPRFVALLVNEHSDRLEGLYHEFSQLVAVAIYPLASILVAFSGPALFAWTGRADYASEGHVVLSLVALATGLNSLLYLPLQLQLAARWTNLTLLTNAISAVLYVPILVLLTKRYGIVGAGIGLVLLMVGQLAIVPVVMHRRLLKGARTRWYLRDVLVPLLPSLSVGILSTFVFQVPSSRMGIVGTLFLLWILLIGATLACAPLALRRVRSIVQRSGYGV